MDIERRKALAHVMANVRLRRQVYQLRKKAIYTGSILAAFGLAVACSGCGMKGRIDGGRGYVNLEADEAGMHAFSHLIQGAITNGKASNDIKSAHYELTEKMERERTMRENQPGFLSNLFGVREGQ